jgi:hypothetical protein
VTMDSEPGRSLILWTVRLAVACYLAAVWIDRRTARSRTCQVRCFRVFWSSAWGLVVIHVLFAYHFQHHWNQAAALQHTAEMTERVVGWYWSGGLYINYLFLAVWGVDVVRLLRSPERPSSTLMHLIAAFMMFNATVVFGPSWWIVVILPFVVAYALHSLRRWNERSAESADTN